MNVDLFKYRGVGFNGCCCMDLMLRYAIRFVVALLFMFIAFNPSYCHALLIVLKYFILQIQLQASKTTCFIVI